MGIGIPTYGDFDSSESVLTLVRDAIDDGSLDSDMLHSCWLIIVSENERERVFVSESDLSQWDSFRKQIDDGLASATTERERMKAMDPLLRVLRAERTQDSYNEFNGVRYGNGMIHARPY